jgi:hypothetical protein
VTRDSAPRAGDPSERVFGKARSVPAWIVVTRD